MPRHRLSVVLSSLAVAAWLSACGQDQGAYPAGWPPVAVSWFASCPDLAGTYDVRSGLLPTLPVSQLEGGPRGPRWEQLVIDGTPAGRLHVLARAPVVRGGITLARDTEHGLVADESQGIVTSQINVWCGDGCVGIPTGLARKHRWARWDRVAR